MDHLTDGDVEEFLAGGLPREAFRRVIRHLMEPCRPCGARVLEAVPRHAFLSAAPPTEPDAYDAAIDRAWKKARGLRRRWKDDQERFDRGREWLSSSPAGFSGLTHGQRQSLVPWVHVEILLWRSFEARYRDPRKMLEDADRAVYVADRIEKTPYGPGFLSDLRVRCWTELANAYRVNENYRYADAAVRQAQEILDQGTGDLALRARIAEVEASIRKDQRHFAAAGEMLDEAFGIYRKLGERHLAGRALTSKAIALALDHRPAEAARLFRRALPLLDASRDPQLVTTSQYNLLDALVRAGDLHGAIHLLVQTNLREDFATDPLNRARLRWVEGKILARQKRYAEAEKVFAEVRAGFRSIRLEYVAAVAGVDQTLMLVRMKKLHDAHLVARDLVVEFRRQEYHNNVNAEEPLKALTFLEHVCAFKVVNAFMAEAVRNFLDEAQRDRGLRFDMAGVMRRGMELKGEG